MQKGVKISCQKMKVTFGHYRTGNTNRLLQSGVSVSKSYFSLSFVVFDNSTQIDFVLFCSPRSSTAFLCVLNYHSLNRSDHRLNMKVDLQSLFGLHVT